VGITGHADLKTFAIQLAYDGTAYAGWQRQSEVRSIQGVLEEAATAVNGQPTKILGAGRTDAGVHARAQAARFRTPRALAAHQVPHALNSHLPPDIRVHNAVEVEEAFHPIGDSVGKHYRYTIRVATVDSPFDVRYVHRVRARPDCDAMRRAARELCGTHDFKGFEKSGSPRPNTIRTLARVDLREWEEYIAIDFEGDGFLYGMARNLAGTLLRVGQGKLDAAAITAALASTAPEFGGPCLPARGLSLIHVAYPFRWYPAGDSDR
jgi:tRNA pseudouridine38-40 synthase